LDDYPVIYLAISSLKFIMKEAVSLQSLVANRDEILCVMPYGEDFCFLDRILSMEEDDNGIKIVAEYDVRQEDCKGHFNKIAIFPGVKIQEAIAQTGVFWLRRQEKYKDYIAMFTGKFEGAYHDQSRPLFPGDTLQLHFLVLNFDEMRKGQATGLARIDEMPIMVFDFSFTIIKEGVLKKMAGKVKK